jgi:hypothetical protein
MTAQEFSMEFDVLFNNIMSGKAPGINNYEKSVFLTKAQDEILKSHFQSEGNKYKEGFNESIKRDTDFSFLVTLVEIDEEGRTNTFYNNSIRFKIPDTMFLPINFLIYYVIDGVINELIVIPMREDEIIKLRSKPYKEPFRGYAYKIDNCTASLNQYEIITGSEFFNKSATEKSKLKIRYIRYP